MTRWLTLSLLLTAGAVATAQPPKKDPPQVEIVFCIDTTGSMGDMLEVMCERVFAICNKVKAAKQNPDLKVGLVAYKDRGDVYVTKATTMTTDLDFIYGELKGLTADGGGDIPESVNQALNEAVTKMGWDASPKTMKLVFVIGDAPPHMDYKDDVKYPDTCKIAVKKGIIINTVRNGTDLNCAGHFSEMAKLGKGEFITVPQNGGKGISTPSPQDKRLAEINAELIKLAVPYGKDVTRTAYAKKLEKVAALPDYAAADRAVIEARRSTVNEADLAEMVQAGKLKLTDLTDEDLTAEVRKLPTGDRMDWLAGRSKKRAELAKEALELDAKRVAFLTKSLKEAERKKEPKSFDQLIHEVLTKQGKRFGLGF